VPPVDFLVMWFEFPRAHAPLMSTVTTAVMDNTVDGTSGSFVS
jgi:hypothetical protein